MGNVAVQPSSDSRSPLCAAPESSKTSSIAALAIAVIGAAVMIDLAVETFLGGSALRWWAVAAAVAYLGLIVVTRRRGIGWSSQLTIVLVFALGLTAATAWRPAGLADGIRLAGQPTSRVLAGLTAAALIVAIVTILRATVFPLAVRLVVSLLALYGLAAFALGAWQTTAYPALFAGDSIWRALPRWLQGAVLGGLVALPLALLASLLGGLRRDRRAWQPQPIIALALAVAVAASGFTNATGVGQSGMSLDLSGTGVSASAEAPDSLAPDQRSTSDAIALLKQVAAGPPSSSFDVDTKAAEIGSDPAALFAFMREHIRTEIYAGILRGARGTLMAGAGNAWDQALLLAAMLRHHGRQVRFARTHLGQDKAADVVELMFAEAARPRSATTTRPDVPDSLQKQSRALLARIEANWRRAHAQVLQAVDQASLSLGDTATSRDALAAEAADHVWVEYQEGDRWIALDPVATAAAGTSVASDGDSFSEVPDAFYHHVTIRVWIEERHDQKLAQKEAFRLPTTAAALNGEQVVLWHKFDHDITGGWRATPVLQIGGDYYAARTFSAAGIVAGAANNKEDLISQAHEAVGQLGKVTDVFGNSNTPAAAAAPESGFTAETLEVEFTDPAKHSEVARREMFDRIGFVARAGQRAATAPLAPIAMQGDVPARLAGVYACAFTAGGLDPTLVMRGLSSRAQTLEAAVSANSGAAPQWNEALPAILWTAAASVHVASQLIAPRMRSTGNDQVVFYEASPRLAIASLELVSSSGGSRPSFAIDLRRNHVRVVGRRVRAKDLVRTNLARGILDAAIEDSAAAGAAGRPGASVLSTVAVLSEARHENVTVAAMSDGSAVGTLPLPDEARARMQDFLGERKAIVAARQPIPVDSMPHAAWWNVDLATGETVAMLDNGLHGGGEFGEDATIKAQVDLPFARTLADPLAKTLPLPGSNLMGPSAAMFVGFGLGVLTMGAGIFALSFFVTK